MKRILIVDDAIDLGRLLQDILKSVYPDIPVTVVPSAEEALLESTRYTFELLVTDVRLPGMSGMELIRKIRVRQPKIKVIMMTGLMMDDRLEKQKNEANPDAFLPKPLIPTVFLEAVERLIGVEQAPPPAQQAAEKTVTTPLPTAQKTPAQTMVLPAQEVSGAQPAPEGLLKEMADILPGEPAEKQPTQTRRFSTGRLGTAPLQQAQPEESGFSPILSNLRGSLGAVVAMLLDERGYPVAQAGDLPDPALQTQLIAPLLASLSASAKVSYLLGLPDAEMVQAYRGAELDLVIAPVGQYTLLIGLKAARSGIRMALAFEEALNAQSGLAALLEGMGLHVKTAVEAGAPETLLAEMSGSQPAEEVLPPEILETPLGQDLNLEKFEELFSKKKTGQLRLEDPDTFWDTASTGEKKDVSQPGVLTFEQAQKLGLFPPDEEK